MPRAEGGGVDDRVVAVVGTRYADYAIESELIPDTVAALRIAGGATRAELLEAVKDATVVLTGAAPRFDAEVLRSMGGCRAIVRYGVGMDNIDAEAAASLGIRLFNVPDYCREEVSGHTVAMILAFSRRLFDAAAIIHDGGWGISGLRPIRATSDETVGVVGAGRIGRRVAEKLLALGYRVLVHDPAVQVDWAPACDFDELLGASDYVTLHLPLSETTRHLLDARALRRMKPDAVLVNTARGGLVDDDALLAAIEAGRLRGAALDVFEAEPKPDPRLTSHPRILATPHIGWYSERSERELREKAAAQAAAVLGEEAAPAHL